MSMRPDQAGEEKQAVFPSEPPDLREKGAPINGTPQISERRLFVQLQVFRRSPQTDSLIEPLKELSLDTVLYHDLNNPDGVGLLMMSEDAAELISEGRKLIATPPFSSLQREPAFTMTGRTYASGREADLEDWLLEKPRRTALNPDWPWAIWYPLRRKPEFYLLPRQEAGKILMEHARIGYSYAQGNYAHDIRLACFGMDPHDNEFVIGLMGPELYPLSHIVQEMRRTQQTAKYIASLGPFFVGKVCWQSGGR